MNKIKKQICPIKLIFFYFLTIKIHRKIHIAFSREALGKNRAKNIEFPYSIFSA